MVMRIGHALPLIVALVVLGCTGQTGAPGPATTVPSATRTPAPATQAPTTPTTPRTASPSPAPSPTLPPAVCPTERGGDQAASRTVAELRVGAHEGYDRVVFDFGPGALPPYVVEQAREFVGPSGMPTPVAGNAFIGVRFPRAGHMGAYRGPRDLARPAPSIVEVKVVEDFEGVLVFGIGLARHTCPRVTVLGSPARLVLDFPR